MQYMVTTVRGHATKYRLFESYDKAVIYHDRQVDDMYFTNQLRNIEIDTIRTYGGRIVSTNIIEWLEDDTLKAIGYVKITEMEEE